MWDSTIKSHCVYHIYLFVHTPANRKTSGTAIECVWQNPGCAQLVDQLPHLFAYVIKLAPVFARKLGPLCLTFMWCNTVHNLRVSIVGVIRSYQNKKIIHLHNDISPNTGPILRPSSQSLIGHFVDGELNRWHPPAELFQPNGRTRTGRHSSQWPDSKYTLAPFGSLLLAMERNNHSIIKQACQWRMSQMHILLWPSTQIEVTLLA